MVDYQNDFSYRSLLQELLHALLGYDGDVFIRTSRIRCACPRPCRRRLRPWM